MATEKVFQSFKEFYPYYLTEHANPINYRLHFVGTSLVLLSFFGGILTGHGWWLFLTPFFGYGFAWFGHFIFEKNKPATFTYPLWSLSSDFVMYWHILTGQISKKLDEAHAIEGIENKWKKA